MPLHATFAEALLPLLLASFTGAHPESPALQYIFPLIHQGHEEKLYSFIWQYPFTYYYYHILCQSILWDACGWPRVFQTLSSHFPPQSSHWLILLFLKVWCSNLDIVLLLPSKWRDKLTSNIFTDNTSGYAVEYCTFVAISASENTTDLCNLKSDLTL